MTEAEAFLEQYRLLHKDPKVFEGRSILPYAFHVKELVLKYKSKSLLDFGCGKGRQYTEMHVHAWWDIQPALYDPAVPKYATLPAGKFDGVICTDVMEHVPESAVDATLEQIFGFARQWVFFTICTRPANRILPNGQNAHCTIQPREWWMDKINALATIHRVGRRVEFT